MIVDTWWVNLITVILVIVLFVCTLVLYLHMNKAQQKEERNIALLATGSVMFALILIILVVDIGLEYSRDKRTQMEKEREVLRQRMKEPAQPPKKTVEDNDYSTVRKS